MKTKWSIDEALRWAETWSLLEDPSAPTGDQMAIDALAHEIRRLRSEVDRQCGVIRDVNARCDHLGMRLRDVMAERDALRAATLGDAPSTRSIGCRLCGYEGCQQPCALQSAP